MIKDPWISLDKTSDLHFFMGLMSNPGRSKDFCYHYNDVIMGVVASQITSLTIFYSTSDCLLNTGADQRKHQSSAPLAFARGIYRRLVNSPHKWPVTRKMFLFDDIIMLQLFGMIPSLIQSTQSAFPLKAVPIKIFDPDFTGCHYEVIGFIRSLHTNVSSLCVRLHWNIQCVKV